MDPPRYARLEDEQRYVVASVPEASRAPREIEDRYVRGTRLRLRTVRDEAATVRKLGQKVRVHPARPTPVWHTTVYLDDVEFDALEGLGAATLRKRRWTIGEAAVDEFLGELFGLVLVEGPRGFPAPVVGVEVTDDERFCGAALASLDDAGARAILLTARELLS